MPRRTRSLIGALFMVGFVVVYALTAMVLAQAPVLQKAPGLVQMLVYAILGMSWILPLMPVIRWMEKPDVLSSDVQATPAIPKSEGQA